MSQSEVIQQKYYTDTAAQFDAMHGGEEEHNTALKYIRGFMAQLELSTVLDVGAGTGRALKYFLGKGIDARGVEPVPALVQQAVEKNGVPADRITVHKGEVLPFPDRTFDAVCETGVLHHVPRPNDVV